jgi:hypothetical protein
MPERTERLVKAVRQWIEANSIRQVDLATQLGTSPQGLWNALNRKSELTGEQALHLEELLLKDKSTSSIRVDPPKLPANARDHNNEPKTLLQAKE